MKWARREKKRKKMKILELTVVAASTLDADVVGIAAESNRDEERENDEPFHIEFRSISMGIKIFF